MPSTSALSLAARVLCAGFPGTSRPEALRGVLAEGELAGVILFKRNFTTPAEAAELFEHCQPTRGPRALTCIDQEGGRVARLGAPVVKLPPMRKLGDRDDVALTRRAGEILGAQLTALGIAVDFAPVLDVDTNPANPIIGDRSFGRTPDVVVRHGLAFADGLRAAGVITCAKHFPGHGDTELDSHLALPRVAHDAARLAAVELAPFRACRGRIPMIMTAHVVYPALEEGVPATLSRAVVTDLLRGELGYDGVVVSDDLEMKAVADHFGVEESAVRAIEAGCDLLLVCSDVERLLAARVALAERADASPTFAARLADAAQRVDALRGTIVVRRGPIPDGSALEAELS